MKIHVLNQLFWLSECLDTFRRTTGFLSWVTRVVGGRGRRRKQGRQVEDDDDNDDEDDNEDGEEVGVGQQQ